MTPAPRRNPLLKQWVILLAALLLAAGWCSLSGTFWRLDKSLYDAALPGGRAPSDVVIVAIDDASIAELGRWPWRRALHAALLDRLRSLGARAVALDLLLTEPDPESPLGDIALATAMGRGPPTVLPLLVEMPGAHQPLRERLPIPLFAQAAAGIGHAHLELDRDGVVRSVFLLEGLGAPRWPHFAVALLDSVPGAAPVVLRGARHPDLAAAPAGVWVRDHQILIPFLGPPGHFRQVSYVDVIRGTVPAEAIRDKLVLVGATAQGIGDAYPTPRSGEGRVMAGVEITANVLQALRSGSDIRALPPWASLCLTLVAIGVAAVALLLFAPWQSLTAVAAIAAAVLAACVLGLRQGGWWWPPSAALAALLLIYPLWSWRRLAATLAFLDEEFRMLAGERAPILGAPLAAPGTLPPFDFVAQRLDVLREASARLRAARRLLADTIANLPDATLLVDLAGRIVLTNQAAAALFGALDPHALEDTLLDAQLFARSQTDASRFTALAATSPGTVETLLADTGRQVLIRSVPFCTVAGQRVGTILALADITALRVAQAERDDVLRFLSHDMKSPASSLLGLAHLQRDPNRALAPQELAARLDRLGQRLLSLVDGFVDLARAGAADPHAFEDFDLCDAVKDAYDEVWASARARNTAIQIDLPEEPAMVYGDRQLLARAVVNLLSNAVKFSAPDSSIELSGRQVGGDIIVTVADQGAGISAEDVPLLFKRFSRRPQRGAADPGGAGLGLAFVKVVADKHGGRAWVQSVPNDGAVFCLAVPLRVAGQA